MSTFWADYSGACAVLVPETELGAWHGMLVPDDSDDPDVRLAGKGWRIDDELDFENPRTDYDHACAGALGEAVIVLERRGVRILVLGLELDLLTWWADEKMVVNGWCLPDPSKLERVEWERVGTFELTAGRYRLMNATEHGEEPDGELGFTIELEPARYHVNWGQYGWESDDPWLLLWRFERA